MKGILNRALTKGLSLADRAVQRLLDLSIEGYGRCGCAEAGVDLAPGAGTSEDAGGADRGTQPDQSRDLSS